MAIGQTKNVLALLVSVVLLTSVAATAESCTDAEVDVILKLNATVGDAGCSDDENTVDELCDSATCLATLKQVATELPDCEYFGVNMRANLESALSICDARSSSSYSDYSPVVGSSSSTSDSAECTSSEMSQIQSALNEGNSECADLDVSASVTTFSELCDSIPSDCMDYFGDLATDLPDCAVRDLNIKGFFESLVKECGGSNSAATVPLGAVALATSIAVTLLV